MKLVPHLIIHQSIALYRKNFKLFFRLSLLSTGWFLVANLSFFIVLVFLAISAASFTFLVTTMGFIIPSEYIILVPIAVLSSIVLAIALSIFSSAKGHVRLASIGYIAHKYLIDSKQETPQIMFRQMQPQFRDFWLLQFRIDAFISLVGVATSTFNWLPLTAIGLGIQLWMVAQWFIASMFISVNRYSVSDALLMSNRELNPYMVQICLILIITWVLTAPIYLLTILPMLVVWLVDFKDASVFTGLDPILHLIQALGLSIIFGTLLSSLINPLFQSIKAVVYTSIDDDLSSFSDKDNYLKGRQNGCIEILD